MASLLVQQKVLARRQDKELSEKRVAPYAQPVALSVLMVIVLAGTLFISKWVALASMVALAAAVLYFAYNEQITAVALLTWYSAFEGMYKYLTSFSQVVYVVKPILELAILIVGLIVVNRHNLKTHKPPMAALIGVMIGWATAIIFHPDGAGLVEGLATYLVWYLTPVLLYFITYNSGRTVAAVETICYTMVAVGTIVSLFACLQYMMGQGWTMSHLPGYERVNQGDWWIVNAKGQVTNTSWRPASTTSMGGGGGIWSQRAIIPAIGLLMYSKTPKAIKPWLYLSLAINVAGIVVSGCRLFLIAGIIEVALLMLITSRNPSTLARNIGLLILLGGLTTLGTVVAQSISGGLITSRYADTLQDPLGRYNHDRGGLVGRGVMLLSNLEEFPTGIGYQRSIEGGRQQEVAGDALRISRDDQFNATAADWGIPGEILVLAFIVVSLLLGWTAFRGTAPTLKPFAGLLYSLHVGNIVMSLGGPVLAGNENLWIVLALLMAVRTISVRDEKLEKVLP